MVWAIHSWSSDDGVGTIASSHFGPFPFGASENVDQVGDFVVGEAVWAELDGRAPNFEVRVVRPVRARQPAGVWWPPFDSVNGRFGDARLEERSDATLQFWLGDCCDYCTPNPTRVRFEGVTSVVGLGDDVLFESPFLRLASADEVEANHLDAPPDSKVFCMVTDHFQGHGGPRIFIVARSVEVMNPQDRP